MIGIVVLFCMEMVIDGGKEMVIGGDIHDDHVILIGICIGLDHVICNCPGYDNREMIDHRDLWLPYRHLVLDYELFLLLNNQFESDDREHQDQQHPSWHRLRLQYLRM